MKLIKENMRKIIVDNFDLRMETFIFLKDDKEYTARSKYEGINALVKSDDLKWEKNLIDHIKWQLGI